MVVPLSRCPAVPLPRDCSLQVLSRPASGLPVTQGLSVDWGTLAA